MSKNMLLVLSIPDEVDDEPDDDDEYVEMVASELVAMINDERRRNWAEGWPEGERPDFQPVMVSAIPSPQYLDGAGMKMLVDSILLMRQAHEMAAQSREGRLMG